MGLLWGLFCVSAASFAPFGDFFGASFWPLWAALGPLWGPLRASLGGFFCASLGLVRACLGLLCGKERGGGNGHARSSTNSRKEAQLPIFAQGGTHAEACPSSPASTRNHGSFVAVLRRAGSSRDLVPRNTCLIKQVRRTRQPPVWLRAVANVELMWAAGCRGDILADVFQHGLPQLHSAAHCPSQGIVGRLAFSCEDARLPQAMQQETPQRRCPSRPRRTAPPNALKHAKGGLARNKTRSPCASLPDRGRCNPYNRTNRPQPQHTHNDKAAEELLGQAVPLTPWDGGASPASRLSRNTRAEPAWSSRASRAVAAGVAHVVARLRGPPGSQWSSPRFHKSLKGPLTGRHRRPTKRRRTGARPDSQGSSPRSAGGKGSASQKTARPPPNLCTP